MENLNIINGIEANVIVSRDKCTLETYEALLNAMKNQSVTSQEHAQKRQLSIASAELEIKRCKERLKEYQVIQQMAWN